MFTEATTTQQLPRDRSSRVQMAIVSLATLAAAALLGLVLAYWVWEFLAPPVELRIPASEKPSSGADAARALFGAPQSGRPATTGLAVKLLGVVATPRLRRGYAVVQLDGRDTLVVSEGNDVFPGVKLAEVHPDHVVLERGGVRETLAWPEKSVAAAPQGTR